MHRCWLLTPILAVALFALGPISALAAPAHSQAVQAVPSFSEDFSGVELFPGTQSGGSVHGATFSGWFAGTGQNPGGWSPCTAAYCGGWTVVINYRGTPGPGSEVTITGGKWALTLPDRQAYAETVIRGGKVTWPAQGGDAGCGVDVATVSATLLFFSGELGALSGCLDDMHPSTVFPPHIWGTVVAPAS